MTQRGGNKNYSGEKEKYNRVFMSYTFQRYIFLFSMDFSKQFIFLDHSGFERMFSKKFRDPPKPMKKKKKLFCNFWTD